MIMQLNMSINDTSSRKADPGWQYGVADPKDPNVIKCCFCDKVTKGGIYRHKQHLVGGYRNATACKRYLPNVAEEIRNYMAKRKELKEQMNEIPDFDEIGEEDEDEEDTDALETTTKSSGGSVKSKLKRPASTSKQKGPMDLYFNVEPEIAAKKMKGKQSTLTFCKKELRDQAVQRFFRWMYDAGLPFNCVNYDSFGAMIEAVGRHCPGMKPPTYHEGRVTYLKKELAHTENLMKKNTEEWPI